MGIIITGPSGPSADDVQALIDEAVGSLGPSLPPGGDPGNALIKQSPADGDAAWDTPPTIVVSRAWESPTLYYTQSFASGIPAAMTASFIGSGTQVQPSVVAMSAAAGTTKPAYSNALVITGLTTGSAPARSSRVVLDLNALTALSGKTPLMVKWWELGTKPGTATGLIELYDGSTQRTSNTLPESDWVQRSAVLTSINNDIAWAVSNVSTTGTPVNVAYITGIEIYGTPSPYMLGDLVAYSGHVYRSTQDNNPYTPGSGQGWVQV